MAAVHPAPSGFAERRPSGPKPALARLAAAAAAGTAVGTPGGEEADGRYGEAGLSAAWASRGRSASPPPRRGSWPAPRRGSAGSSTGLGGAAGAWRRRAWAASLDGLPWATAHAALLAVAVFGADACVLLRLPDAGPPRAALDAALLVVLAAWCGEWALRVACVPGYTRTLVCATDFCSAIAVVADLSWLAAATATPTGAALLRAARAARLVRASRLARALHAAHAALAARRTAAHAATAHHANSRVTRDAPAPTAIAAALSEDVTHKVRAAWRAAHARTRARAHCTFCTPASRAKSHAPTHETSVS
jgi:hypothetical protein